MSRSTQLLNLAQLFLAPLPACLLSRHLLNEGAQTYTHGWVGLPTTISASLSPFALANLLLAFSLFLGWLASLLQRSTWLIDPYWTLVPPLLDLFYKTACSSSGKKGNFSSSSPLATAATLLLLLWSMRLTHSYFRREKWEVGRREDWRYAEMRGRWGRHWWWWQLVPVYLVQHLLLVGLALPSFALRCCSSSSPSGGCLPSCVFSSSASSSARSSSGRLPLSYGQLGGFLVSRRRGGAENAAAAASVPWHPLFDSLAVAAALSGLLLALFADSQLHAFVSSREEERRRGDPARVLDSGLWALSRHPNYLGETIFHLSLAALAVSGRYFSGSAGGAASPSPLSFSVLWPLAGAALNTACLVAVTRMTEERTARAKGREEAWERYRSRTPCWVPRAGPLARSLLSGSSSLFSSPSSSSSSAAGGGATKPTAAAARPRARQR